MGDDQNGRRPKWNMTKMEDDQNGRRPKWKTTKMEDDQNGRRPKWKTTKMGTAQSKIQFHLGHSSNYNLTRCMLEFQVQHLMSQPNCVIKVRLLSCLKMEDNLYQNGRLPQPKWKMTSPKMEDDLTQNGIRPKWKTTKMEDDQNGRRPKWKTTKMEDDHNGRQ